MRIRQILSTAIVLIASVNVAQADTVKLSESLICHTQQSPWYGKTTNFIAYDSLDACLNAGGRLPNTEKGAVDSASRSSEKIPYKREYFGDGWADLDSDCHDTRAEVLQELSTGTVNYRSNGCTVDRGKWISLFTNKEYYKAKELDVDHVVPLALAWERGAYAWSYSKRIRFANDMTNLIPVEAYLNRQKGAKSIGEWLPPNNQCEYAARFTRISKRYQLALSAEDEFVLMNCKNGWYDKDSTAENRSSINLGLFKINTQWDFRFGKENTQ